MQNSRKTKEQVVELICEGYSNKQIAELLYITEKTVKFHCTRIYKEYGVTSCRQLISKLLRQKIALLTPQIEAPILEQKKDDGLPIGLKFRS